MKCKHILAAILVAVMAITGIPSVPVTAESHPTGDLEELKMTRIDLPENVTFTMTQSSRSSTETINALADRACSYYGYHDTVNRANSEGRQALYHDLMQTSIEFWNSDADIESISSYFGDYYILKEFHLADYGITDEDAAEVYFMFRNDNPLFYFISNEFSYGYNTLMGEKDYYFYFRIYPEFAEGSVRNEYNTQIEEFIADYADCTGSGYLYTDAKAIYDKLALSMNYAYDANGVPSMTTAAHTIIGGIAEGYGVCESYARIYEMLCNYYGIENIFVSGTSRNEGHTWNVIRLDDGKYYYADCTWDDHGAFVSDMYFAKGAQTYQNDHIPDSPEGTRSRYLYALPEISEDDFDPSVLELLSPTDTTEPTENETDALTVTVYGDVDDNGTVQMVDMIALNKYLMIGEPISEQGLVNADVNCNGMLEQDDGLNILRAVIGLITLPVTST